MNLNEFKRWLDDRIATIGPELERLLNARRALEQAEEELQRDEALTDRARKASLQRDAAVRKQEGQKRLPRQPAKTGEWARIRTVVRQTIRGATAPLSSRDFVQAAYPDKTTFSKREHDRVYAVLAQYKGSGLFKRTPEGWTLADPTAAVDITEPKDGTNG